jgi:hypothetical protein
LVSQNKSINCSISSTNKALQATDAWLRILETPERGKEKGKLLHFTGIIYNFVGK